MAAPQVDFGKAASSYARHRQGFPPDFYSRLEQVGVSFDGTTALDIGTGTGLFARAMAARGAQVTGLDSSASMLNEARAANGPGQAVRYVEGSAEKTGLPATSFDIVSAATCWHWFDRDAASREAARLLKPDGALVICHLDWRRGPTGVIELTSSICQMFNPGFRSTLPANTFQYPAWLGDIRTAGLGKTDVFGYSTSLRYTHEGWVERVKASASIGPAPTPSEVERFGKVFMEELRALQPAEPIEVEHSVFCVVARRD